MCAQAGKRARPKPKTKKGLQVEYSRCEGASVMCVCVCCLEHHCNAKCLFRKSKTEEEKKNLKFTEFHCVSMFPFCVRIAAHTYTTFSTNTDFHIYKRFTDRQTLIRNSLKWKIALYHVGWLDLVHFVFGLVWSVGWLRFSALARIRQGRLKISQAHKLVMHLNY